MIGLFQRAVKKGIHKLYSHQRSAMDALNEGKNIVVVTPTSSGKTMCYNLPVLDAILKDENPEHYICSDQGIVC